MAEAMQLCRTPCRPKPLPHEGSRHGVSGSLTSATVSGAVVLSPWDKLCLVCLLACRCLSMGHEDMSGDHRRLHEGATFNRTGMQSSIAQQSASRTLHPEERSRVPCLNVYAPSSPCLPVKNRKWLQAMEATVVGQSFVAGMCSCSFRITSANQQMPPRFGLSNNWPGLGDGGGYPATDENGRCRWLP